MNQLNETPKDAARRLAAAPLRQGFTPQALHEYTDYEGKPLYWRIRLKNLATGNKWIRPMKLTEEGYALGEPEFPEGKPLYRLHDLADRPYEVVNVVEGEKPADALAKLGLLATTSGAADSASKADWACLATRTITIWPDFDEAGQRYASAVADILLSLGCTVRMVDVDALNIQPKGDAVDWLNANPDATAEDVLALRSTVIAAVIDTEVAQCARDPVQSGSDNERIEYLANLPPIEYDRQREAQAKALGVRAATLDKTVKAARQEKTSTDGMDFDEIEPWPQPVDADTLLSELYETVKRFIICPEETAHAAALWIAMTWFMDVVQVAPLAVITAPEKRCGKSQLLFLLGRLVYRPLAASNITPAALFRAVYAWKPTLLVDEADAFMKDNEELRGLLNCGHTRESAYIVRVVGEEHTPKRFNVWGAKALAGIGQLADTLMDRAIVLELRRKLPHEQVQRLRHAEPELFKRLSSQLARFAQDSRDALRRSRPNLPESLNDRAQDNWEPLLAIAELAGKQWADLAHRAALRLSGGGEEGGTVGNELLADIQEIFETKKLLKISTVELIENLCNDDEKAWASYNRGKPIAPRQVARKLKEYGIASKTIRIGYDTAKGFEAEQFKEAFARYLSPSSENAVLSVTPSQASNRNAYSVTDYPQRYVSRKLSGTPQALPIQGCDAVTDKFRESQVGEIIEVEL